MELRHLRYFIAVAEELHFTRAATRLGIGQPPLSQQIQHLEKEIGTLLFQRTSRGVLLTEAGTSFLAQAKELLERLNEAVELTRNIGAGNVGQLRFGFSGSVTFNPLVHSFIRQFSSEYPQVQLHLSESNTAQLTIDLLKDNLELALIRTPHTLPAGFVCEELAAEKLIAAIPIHHRLAKRARISLASLASEPFITHPREIGPGLYDTVIRACALAGFVPRIVQQAPQMASIVGLVAAGLGVAIVPSTLHEVHAGHVAYRPLAEPLRATLALAYRRDCINPSVINAAAMIRKLGKD